MDFTFEQNVVVADLGDRDVLDGEFGGLSRHVNRAQRGLWHATHLGVVERLHGSGRHGEKLG